MARGATSIHRAVWGPGTRTQDEAFHYVDEQIAMLVDSPSRDTHVVDLGCGIGASLCYLAERLPIRGTGITLSATQAAMSKKVIAAAGFADRVECFEGDYCNLPTHVRHADLAYAIESFVHGPSPERFFEQCHRLLKPGRRLAICDDVKTGAMSPEAARSVDEFARGWHVNTLLDRDALVRAASEAGFEHESAIDLTPLLEINRMRDRVIRAVVTLLKWLPVDRARFDYVIGGDALQTCLAKGWLRYELNVFRAR